MPEKLPMSISKFYNDSQHNVASSPFITMDHFTFGNLELVEKFPEPDNHDHT